MKKHIKKTTARALLAALLTTLLLPVIPTPVLAEDACTHVSVDAAGLCNDCQTQMVASVTADGTTTYHAELADAFAAANGKTATIDQLSDYTFPPNNTTARFEYGALLDSGDVIWNMNGYDITFGNGSYDDTKKEYYVGIKLTSGAKLTVNADGSTWTATEYIHCDNAFYNSGSELTVNKGTFTVYDTAFSVASSGTTTINDTVASSLNTYAVYSFHGKVALSNVNISTNGKYAVVLAGSARSSIGYGTYGSVYISNSTLNSYYKGDFRNLMPEGASIIKNDGTALSDSDLQEVSIAGNAGILLPAIVVSGCDHDGETYVEPLGTNNYHAIHCALCRIALRTEACSGGTADCLSLAVCTLCSGTYGELNIDNHVSDTYEYVYLGDGTHDKVHACCTEFVANEACTREGDICTVCGGVDLSEEFAVAEAQMTAALNEKLERLNARTDIDETTKVKIVEHYDIYFNQLINSISRAQTAEDMEITTQLSLALLDIEEGMIDLELRVELNAEDLTATDTGFLEQEMLIVTMMYRESMGQVTPDEFALIARACCEILDYAEACVDLFVHINTLPNISTLTDGDKDLIKLYLFGGEYQEMDLNATLIYYGFTVYGAEDLTVAIAYGTNEIWKTAADLIDADWNNNETYDAVVATSNSIRSEMSATLSIETSTVADVEAFVEIAKIKLEYARVKIDSVSLTLGDRIDFNYYVSKVDGVTPQITFTINGQSKTVTGVDDGEMLKFVFDGVAPQWMGDLVTAELIVNGTVIEVKKYSVLGYLEDLAAKTPTELGISEAKYAAMNTLIIDLVVYGGAAQIYTGYNTDALVSENVTGSEFTTIESTDASVENGTNVQFTGATVFFNNVNALMFRFTATDVSDLVLKVKVNNGEEVELTYVDNGDGSYIVTTPAIYADCFDDVYTLIAYVNGTADATVTYSVKSYVYSKQNGNGNIAELAKATYNYGIAAKAYKETA